MFYTLMCFALVIWVVLMVGWYLLKAVWETLLRLYRGSAPTKPRRSVQRMAPRFDWDSFQEALDPDDMPDLITPEEIDWALENPHTVRAQTLFDMMDDDEDDA